MWYYFILRKFFHAIYQKIPKCFALISPKIPNSLKKNEIITTLFKQMITLLCLSVVLNLQVMQDLLQSKFHVGFDKDFFDDEIDHRTEGGKKQD